jgi:hypothetical protein
MKVKNIIARTKFVCENIILLGKNKLLQHERMYQICLHGNEAANTQLVVLPFLHTTHASRHKAYILFLFSPYYADYEASGTQCSINPIINYWITTFITQGCHNVAGTIRYCSTILSVTVHEFSAFVVQLAAICPS